MTAMKVLMNLYIIHLVVAMEIIHNQCIKHLHPQHSIPLVDHTTMVPMEAIIMLLLHHHPRGTICNIFSQGNGILFWHLIITINQYRDLVYCIVFS